MCEEPLQPNEWTFLESHDSKLQIKVANNAAAGASSSLNSYLRFWKTKPHPSQEKKKDLRFSFIYTVTFTACDRACTIIPRFSQN